MEKAVVEQNSITSAFCQLLVSSTNLVDKKAAEFEFILCLNKCEKQKTNSLSTVRVCEFFAMLILPAGFGCLKRLGVWCSDANIRMRVRSLTASTEYIH